MRRRLACLLSLSVAAVVTGVLAACGSDDPAAAPGEEQPAATATTAVTTPTPLAPATDGPAPTQTTSAATTTPMPVASVTSTPAPAATATRAAVAQPTATVAAGKRTTGQVDGVIFEVSQGSKATFTVGEELVRVPVPIEAVLSTTNLSGEVRLDGQPSSITINLHSLTSDQANRDRYVRTQMFPQHPTATISIGSVTPLPAGFTDGNEVKAQVKGVLSIRGVEAPMTFEVEARDDGDVVFVVARSSFTWADIGMGAPRAQSVVSVDDTVRVEVLLALRPAGA